MFDTMGGMEISLRDRSGEGVGVVTDGPEVRLCTAMGLVNAATAEVVAAIAAGLADGAGRARASSPPSSGWPCAAG